MRSRPSPSPDATGTRAPRGAVPKRLAVVVAVLLLACVAALWLPQAALAQDEDAMKEDPPKAGESSDNDCIMTDNGCVNDPTPDNDGTDDSTGSDSMKPDENGSEGGNGEDDDGDGSTTDDDSAMGDDNGETGSGNNEQTGGACDIMGVDVCAPVIAAIKGILDKAWTWVVGITERLAEEVMNTAFTLPSLEDGELLGKYDAMVDTVKPAIVVGVLLLALGMMLSPSNVTAQHAILNGLPKIALVGLALAFLPEFVGMMTDITGSLGGAFGEQAEVGKAFGDILADAAFFGTAATVFTANPGVGAIVAGIVLLPLLALLIVVLAVGILVDFLFSILVLLGPVCLVCWPIPALQSVTVVWFRALMACFLIPLLFSIEAAVGSWIVGSPALLTNGHEAGEDWAPALASVCLIVLILVMAATPRKVLDWAFGAAFGGSFSFKGAKSAVQSFTQDLVKSATQTAAPNSALASSLGGAGRGKDRGLSSALAGAAGSAVGANVGAAAKNVNLAGGAAGGSAGGVAVGVAGLVGSAAGGRRGLREQPADPLKSARAAMGADAAASQGKKPSPENARQQNATRQGTSPQSVRDAGLGNAQKIGDKKEAAGEKPQARGAAPDSAGFQKAQAQQHAPGRFEEAKSAYESSAARAQAQVGTPSQAPASAEAPAGPMAAAPHAEPMPTNAGVEQGGLADAQHAAPVGAAEEGLADAQHPVSDAAPQAAPAQGIGEAAQQPAEGWQQHLAQNGFGDGVGDAIGRDAETSGQLAGGAAYQRASAAVTEAGGARADAMNASAQALRRQGNELPGVSNPERGQMRTQAEALESQAASIRSELPKEAHAAGMRASAQASATAAGQYAGEAAHTGALQRADAVRGIAATEATEIGARARNEAQIAQSAFDEAQGRHQLTAGTSNDNPQPLQDLAGNLEQANARAASWAPGGAAYNNHVDGRAAAAYRDEYDALYQRATGNEPARNAGSPGYLPRGTGGPPTFGEGHNPRPAAAPQSGLRGGPQAESGRYGGYHGGDRPTWQPLDEKR